MTKKILLTLGRLERGGAELRTLQLMKVIVNSRPANLYYLYVVSGERGELSPEFEELNLEVIYGRPGLIGVFVFFIKLLFIKPNVVHVNANLAGGVFCFLAWVAGVQHRYSHIRTAKDYGSGFLYSIKKIFFSALTNIFSNKVVGVCDGARELINTPIEKWVTIYNGVEVFSGVFDCAKELTTNVRLVVMGRFHKAKNQVFAVDILRALISNYPLHDWRLVFYGKEDVEIIDQIKTRALCLGVMHYIEFCGISSAPIEDISNCDVLLLPSVREGLPGVVLEAASVGVPSVCSNLPGCIEIGRFLDFVKTLALDDGPDAWAYAVYEVLDNFKNRVRNRSIFVKSPFTFDNHVSKMVELWGGHG